jgi:hypothetical protein
MDKACCLTCQHFKPIAPSDWKPSFQSEEYDLYNVRNIMTKNGGQQQEGLCMLNPTSVEVWTDHACGHFEINESIVPSLHTFLYGNWKEIAYDERNGQVQELTRQLKAARKISRSRLLRIQQLTGKAGHESGEDEVPEPLQRKADRVPHG